MQPYLSPRNGYIHLDMFGSSCTVHSLLLTHFPFNVLRVFFAFISKCITALTDLTTSQIPSDKRPCPLLRSDPIRRCTERGLEETFFHASTWMVTHFHALPCSFGDWLLGDGDRNSLGSVVHFDHCPLTSFTLLWTSTLVLSDTSSPLTSPFCLHPPPSHLLYCGEWDNHK